MTDPDYDDIWGPEPDSEDSGGTMYHWKDVPVVLLISGMDPTGGAGMGTDIRTCYELAVYPVSCVTALTIQNQHGLKKLNPVDSATVRDQLEAILEAVQPDAVKIGLLPNADTVRTVAGVIREHNLKNVVVDPVMTATRGGNFNDDAAISEIASNLSTVTDIMTPNRKEFFALSRFSPESEKPEFIRHAKMVVMTGGDDNGDKLIDYIFTGGHVEQAISKRINTKNLHGTGCVFSTAIASYLAMGRQGRDAIYEAKHFMREILLTSRKQDVIPDYGPCLTISPSDEELPF